MSDTRARGQDRRGRRGAVFSVRVTDEQRAEIERRLDALGPERLGDVVLVLSARKLAAWLADPNSR